MEPGLILASGDSVSVDVEALKILIKYKAKNKLMADPWKMPQIVTAFRHGLGVRGNWYAIVD